MPMLAAWLRRVRLTTLLSVLLLYRTHLRTAPQRAVAEVRPQQKGPAIVWPFFWVRWCQPLTHSSSAISCGVMMRRNITRG